MEGVEGDSWGKDVLPVWVRCFIPQVPQIVPPLLVLNRDCARHDQPVNLLAEGPYALGRRQFRGFQMDSGLGHTQALIGR